MFGQGQAKPLIYDAIRPIFKLYGKEDDFQWYENEDPGTHNYQLDNREHAYRFFEKYLNQPGPPDEIPSDPEIRSYKELAAGLPADNLTILDLARQMARNIQRTPPPAGQVRLRIPGLLQNAPS